MTAPILKIPVMLTSKDGRLVKISLAHCVRFAAARDRMALELGIASSEAGALQLSVEGREIHWETVEDLLQFKRNNRVALLAHNAHVLSKRSSFEVTHIIQYATIDVHGR